MQIEDLAELAKRQRRGEVSEQELADLLRTISTSVSFESALTSFETLYGPPKPTWGESQVSISALDATQPCLEYAKVHLVRWLFATSADFDRLNAKYFPRHPTSVMQLGNGRFAIVDGHHRLWRAGTLLGPSGSVSVRIISSRNQELLANFRRLVQRVAEMNESASLRYLPIRDLPKPEEVARLQNELELPHWLEEIGDAQS